MYHWKNAVVNLTGDVTDASIIRPHNRGGLSVSLLYEVAATCPPLSQHVQLLVPTSCADGREPRYHATESNSPFHVV